MTHEQFSDVHSYAAAVRDNGYALQLRFNLVIAQWQTVQLLSDLKHVQVGLVNKGGNVYDCTLSSALRNADIPQVG